MLIGELCRGLLKYVVSIAPISSTVGMNSMILVRAGNRLFLIEEGIAL